MTLRSSAVGMARRTLRRAGFDLVRALDTASLLKKRHRLLERFGIDLVFDVGANVGQYAQVLRALGYSGRIVSLEPQSSAFCSLQAASARDPLWEVERLAVGEAEGELTLNISRNSQSSSFLAMLPAHVEADPNSQYHRTEIVPVTTLHNLVERSMHAEERLFVKLDTQGYEEQILLGAGPAIDRVLGLQIEMSLVPLYHGHVLIDETISALRSRGFELMAIEPDFWNEQSGQLLQADGIFFRPRPR